MGSPSKSRSNRRGARPRLPRQRSTMSIAMCTIPGMSYAWVADNDSTEYDNLAPALAYDSECVRGLCQYAELIHLQDLKCRHDACLNRLGTNT